MHISLPESLIESAKVQAEEGQYGNVSDYVRSLIRKDVRQREEDKLERMLLEGVRSGRGIEIGSKEWETFWEDIYASIRAKTHSWEERSCNKKLRKMFEIVLYVADDNLKAAEAFRLALERVRLTLADLPEMGRVYDFGKRELKGLRMLPVPDFTKYLVFYGGGSGNLPCSPRRPGYSRVISFKTTASAGQSLSYRFLLSPPATFRAEPRPVVRTIDDS
jgi:antitoxin ParD1/3/4